jgi:hypothetical protein
MDSGNASPQPTIGDKYAASVRRVARPLSRRRAPGKVTEGLLDEGAQTVWARPHLVAVRLYECLKIDDNLVGRRKPTDRDKQEHRDIQ